MVFIALGSQDEIRRANFGIAFAVVERDGPAVGGIHGEPQAAVGPAAGQGLRGGKQQRADALAEEVLLDVERLQLHRKVRMVGTRCVEPDDGETHHVVGVQGNEHVRGGVSQQLRILRRREVRKHVRGDLR